MPDQRLALTRHDVVEHLHATDCAPSSGPVRVGVEQEFHTFCVADPDRHLSPEEVHAAATGGADLPCGSRVTVEPGGQVEVATPPSAPWWDALRALRIDGASVREGLARSGIATLGAGADPFREPVRTSREPRYDAMEAYFDQWGPSGRRMMSGSASIQVNIDNGGPEVEDRRWHLAHRIGPALCAAFACSPGRDHRTSRIAMYSLLDPSRTGTALRSGRLRDDWPAYVLAARVMLLHDHDRCRPMLDPLGFGEWVEHGLAGQRPTLEDLRYHCTTLFPPVRPRGWLELRWLDSLPAGLAEVAVAAVVALLTDDEAGDRADRACQLVADCWETASEQGPRHTALATAAVATLHAAAEALDRTEGGAAYAEGVADAAERWPARGRCPADDLEERLRHGATIVDLADPPQEMHRWC